MSDSGRAGSGPRPAPPLGEDELQEVLRRARSGDEQARELVVRSHLRLVWNIVRRLGWRGGEPDDLFQLGCLGLVKAIERYDPTRGTRFSTYAVPLVLGEMKRYLRDDAPVRVSRRMKELARRALEVKEEMIKKTGREPTVGEIARAVQSDPAEVAECLEATKVPLSLHGWPAGAEEEDSLPLIDRLAAAGEVAAATAPGGRVTAPEEALVESVALREALSRLDERSRRILLLRFFQDRTQAEVGDSLGVSQVQVSRLERQALLRLRELLDD